MYDTIAELPPPPKNKLNLKNRNQVNMVFNKLELCQFCGKANWNANNKWDVVLMLCKYN